MHANTTLEYPLRGRVFRMLQSQILIKIMLMLAGWLSIEMGNCRVALHDKRRVTRERRVESTGLPYLQEYGTEDGMFWRLFTWRFRRDQGFISGDGAL